MYYAGPARALLRYKRIHKRLRLTGGNTYITKQFLLTGLWPREWYTPDRPTYLPLLPEVTK